MRSVKTSKKSNVKKPTKRKAARRKKQLGWKKPVLLGLTALTLLGAPAGAGYYFWQKGVIQDHLNRMEVASLDASMKAGFVLNEVFVHGRKETASADILKALNVKRGQPMVHFDPVDAQEKIEALGWVETASVKRELPNNIIVRIKERVPAAIWQEGKSYTLVDRNGVKISSEDVKRFTHLKVLTGDNAPKNTLALLRIVDQVPDLRERVIGAAWVGDRRWTLHMDNEVSIQLPSENPELAWRKLAVMIQDHDLLNRDIEMIDLRQPDKTVIRMTGSGAKRLLGDEEKA